MVWDVPVAIRLLIPKDMVKFHVTLDRGCRVGVFTCAVDSMLNLKQDPEVSVLVHRPCLERYMMLPSLWQSLQEGRHVACRALSEIPEVLFRAGDASPMACGRAVARDSHEFQTWHKARKSKQYICPSCYDLYSVGLSATPGPS